jgi:hypothetical protein
MSARGILFAVVCAAAALASASPASAYTYTFINGTQQPIRQLWVHTVSAFCHDRNWSGNLAPGGQVNVNSASICLVDRVAVNGGQLSWSSSTGHFGGTFLVLRDGVCFFSSTEAVMSSIAGPAIGAIVPGVGSIAALGLSVAVFRNSGSCR